MKKSKVEQQAEKQKTKLAQRILWGVGIVLLIIVIGFVVWAETPLGPTPEALVALESDAQVTVTTGDYITFQPKYMEAAPVGFIFYPGGRVDARSYAVPLREIAAQGYFVALVPVRLNLAFFDVNAAQKVIADHPEIKSWVVGGHSLGGVAASMFAKGRPDVVGLVFWASYPADDSLKDSKIRVLSIYGSNDMAGADTFKEKEALMPADVQYVVIDGGNHAQFGDYGPQPGDKEATITRIDQQAQTIVAVVNFLASLTNRLSIPL